ncbi:MAG TPA: DNA polymerase III subunit delta [Anaerolineales bacterium]|nr:DNA polymerase III subunit delta [Anaerolineales bacterium]HMV97146.1 DNA polymerase III subunit delta [Anaerolineales bacterium]HMX75191.1 DNA polymerase III subunit delta [Anaerolineales bacterium]HMZ42565.1 DNA polymerase III subunit delta [Anaerolineales bacterium]HNA54997.1 DNA polymerase III subunit delta [Anaerolineales bacterium]
MPNIFLLYGNDEFAISRKLKDFESDFTDPTTADMNTTRLEARTMTENELNNAVNAMPFLAPKRLVFISGPSGKFNNPSTRKKFLEFLEKAPDTAKIVLFETIEPKEAEKHWLTKWAEKNKPQVKPLGFFLPKQRDMPGWIINEAKNLGGQIDPPAAARLAEMVGVDTRQAGMELSKLLAYVNWARPVHGSDVEAVCIVTSQQSVFDFVDALSQGNGKSAQKLLHRLLENEDPFSLWGMVVRQFRLLIQAREILDGRGNKDDVARALGVHPFVAEKTTGQAARFTMESLESIYHRLLGIDERVKTSQITLDLALDTLVVELAR